VINNNVVLCQTCKSLQSRYIDTYAWHSGDTYVCQKTHICVHRCICVWQTYVFYVKHVHRTYRSLCDPEMNVRGHTCVTFWTHAYVCQMTHMCVNMHTYAWYFCVKRTYQSREWKFTDTHMWHLHVHMCTKSHTCVTMCTYMKCQSYALLCQTYVSNISRSTQACVSRTWIFHDTHVWHWCQSYATSIRAFCTYIRWQTYVFLWHTCVPKVTHVCPYVWHIHVFGEFSGFDVDF